MIGTSVSAAFLLIIAALNVFILVNVYKTFQRVKRGETYVAEELDIMLAKSGFFARIFRRLFRMMRKSWHMYPLGFLFGLGFDTATEVALLFVAAGAAFSGLPFYAILCLPILFAAGMCLMDTLDGAFMTQAYGWAFSNPIRKVYYNITVTSLSVVVALAIGSVELLQVLSIRLGFSGGFWDWLNALDSETLGYLVVVLFAVTWATSIVVWKLQRIEERWSAAMVDE
jgi:high-affinity nickel-transport protein